MPDPEDDDPYGVKALEAEGMIVREAGTHHRPSAEVFEFNPAPSSPIYGAYRKSVDGSIRNKTWRDSTASLKSIDHGTQTDDESSPRRGSRLVSSDEKGDAEAGEHKDLHESPERRNSISDIDSDAEIHEVTPVVSRARVVNVPKRAPPALPPRNPGRSVGSPLASEAPTDGFDQISLNGTTSNEEKKPEEGSTLALKQEKDDDDLSRSLTVSQGHAEDKFESIPNSPREEKEDFS